MSIVRWVLGVLVICAFFATDAQSQGAAPQLTVDERQELEIYRASARAGGSAEAYPVPGYQEYVANYYRQRTDIGELAVSALRWQIVASYVLLTLMVILVVSGIGLSCYQLWVAAQLALFTRQQSDDTRADPSHAAFGAESILELSADKVRLQTSFVGILVLLISAGLLVLFIQEVYKIKINRGSAGVVEEIKLPKRETQ
ncbi:hypothetical protein [Xanthobacter versatilis]|uniref:hypothetical protein n=1 Tax=Xanthobacter autotrophicus (strain ATCC BAA-1158 / Py2) TaxID=78245 RepID=UPI00372A4ED5